MYDHTDEKVRPYWRQGTTTYDYVIGASVANARGHGTLNKAEKTALLEAKAKEFPECTYEQLGVFFKSQGTRYGKLFQRANKSGSGGKTLIQRQEWILEKWSFMMSHIVRVETRRSTKKFDKRLPLPRTSSEYESDPLKGTSGSTTSTSQQHSKRSRKTARCTACSTTTEVREAGLEEQIKALMQQAEEAREADCS
ncbi:uncharacterized protein LOC144610557 [Rhinoraja longicauda]